MAEAITIPDSVFEATRTAPEAAAMPNTPETPDSSPKDETPAEVARKIWKLKDGDKEYEYDATDEEQLKRDVMKARAADKRFKEAFETKQQAEQFFNMLKDPAQLRQVLTDPRVGVDLKKLAYDYVLEEMEEAKLTPEQRVQRDRDRRLAEYEERDKKQVERDKSAKNAGRVKEFETHYEQKIIAALEVQGVPREPEIVERMAAYLERSMLMGYDLAPEELAQLVKIETKKYLNTYAESLSEDETLEFLGDKIAEKLRKGDLKRLRTTQSDPFPTRAAPNPSKKPHAQNKKLGSEWRAGLIDEFLAKR